MAKVKGEREGGGETRGWAPQPINDSGAEFRDAEILSA